MSRNATIIISNKTTYGLTLASQQVTHGKITKGPPMSIAAGNEGEIDVAERSGADIGPEGLVIYTIVDGKNSTVQFYWQHPHGSGQSTYWGDPSDPTRYTCDPSKTDPAHPTGHDQEVTIKLSQV